LFNTHFALNKSANYTALSSLVGQHKAENLGIIGNRQKPGLNSKGRLVKEE